MKQKIKLYFVAALCGGCLLALSALFSYLSVWYIINYSSEQNPLYYVWCGFNVLSALSFLLGSYAVTRNMIEDGI